MTFSNASFYIFKTEVSADIGPFSAVTDITKNARHTCGYEYLTMHINNIFIFHLY